MIPELENPPYPLDDTDDGYGDEEDVAGLAPGQVEPGKITDIIDSVRKHHEEMTDELRSGPEGPEDFGEVNDPDDDDTPDPEDFFGQGGAGCR